MFYISFLQSHYLLWGWDVLHLGVGHREVRKREKMEKGDPGCYEVVAGSRVGAGLSWLESRFSSCRDVGQRSPELSMADARTQIVS